MLLIFVISLIAGACATSQRHIGSALNLDTDVKIVFSISDDINPDEKRSPSPLHVRLYELESSDSFLRAEFIDLFQADVDTLGKDLLGRRDLAPLIPGASRTERFTVNANVKYIGLYGEFYQFKNSRFKAVFPITTHNFVKDTIQVEVRGTELYLAAER